MTIGRAPSGGPEPAGERASEQLTRSEAQLEAILRTANDGVVTTDRDGRIIQFSAGAERIFGHRATDVLGTPVSVLVPHRLRAAHLHHERRFAERGGTARHMGTPERLVGLRATGEEFPVEATISKVEVGDDILSTVVIRDVSDRVQAEEAIARHGEELARANAALLESRNRLETVITRAPVILFALDRDGVFTLSEGQGLLPLGLASGEAVGRSAFALFEDLPEAAAPIRQALAGESVATTIRGRGLAFDAQYVPVRDERGVVTGVIGVALDVTERERAGEQLRLLVAAVENTVDAVVITDAAITDPIVRYVNPAFTRLSGYTAAEAVGRPIRSTHAATLDATAMARLLEAATRGETFISESEARRKDGSTTAVELHIAPIRDAEGRVAQFVTVLHDITERKEAERELRRLALHDGLTGLPNRTLLQDRLQHAIAAARRGRSAVALLLLDLDRFKELNDTFGHMAGDDVLRQIGERLRSEIRESDTVARLGGDEFAILLPATDAMAARDVAGKLVRLLERPMTIGEHVIDVVASVGVAVFPDHADDGTGLLRCADIAMYVAKAEGTGSALYGAEKDTYSPARLALTAELRQAIESGALLLHYQPIVHLGDGRLVGVEALLRWPHPTRGLVAPDEFVPLAERTGLMKSLTEWVLGEAFRQRTAWHQGGLGTEIAVNASIRNLADPGFLPFVEGLLRTAGDVAPRVRLEITESVLMADPDRAMGTLDRLRDLDVLTSIDDFGTGYSSLAYLQRLPVDAVKIDRSFVTDMARDEGSAAIVRSIIELSRALNLSTIAEGVEDASTWDRLVALGCGAAQGYYVSRPVPPDQIEPWLRRGGFSRPA